MGVIQHEDRIIRRKDYLPDVLKVTSIFRTLQGEQPFSGRPAIFIRLAGCNFGNKSPSAMCLFCDSSFEFDNGANYSLNSLLIEVLRLKHDGDIVVITGGEPTLQPALPSFISLLQESGIGTVQIETNGTQSSFFREIKSKNINCYVVCSPKGNYKVGIVPTPSITSMEGIRCFRFLLEDVPNSPHREVPSWMKESHKRIFVSPIAVYSKAYDGEVSSIWEPGLIDMEQTGKNYRYAAKYALDYDLELSIQQHLFAALP